METLDQRITVSSIWCVCGFAGSFFFFFWKASSCDLVVLVHDLFNGIIKLFIFSIVPRLDRNEECITRNVLYNIFSIIVRVRCLYELLQDEMG